jgi:hypothetical protein
MNPISQTLFHYNGESRTLQEWAKHLHLPWDTIRVRYMRGDRGDRLLRPAPTNTLKGDHRVKHYLTIDGVTKTIPEWAEHSGLPYHLIINRAKMGWSDDRILKPARKAAPKKVRAPLPRPENPIDLREQFRSALEASRKKLTNDA